VLHQRLHAPTNAPMEQEYALEMAFNFAVIIMETDAQNGVSLIPVLEMNFVEIQLVVI